MRPSNYEFLDIIHRKVWDALIEIPCEMFQAKDLNSFIPLELSTREITAALTYFTETRFLKRFKGPDTVYVYRSLRRLQLHRQTEETQ